MGHLLRLLTLPPTLLALIALTASEVSAEPQWLHNLPVHAKYFPEEEHLVKRGMSALEKLASKPPKAMRKMTGDDSEMFFLDYWEFEDEGSQEQCPISKRSVSEQLIGNLTLDRNLLPPLLLHSESHTQARLGKLPFMARSALLKRDFKCPSGTNACTSLGAPDSCCGTGETCISVADTGLGNVGCCPQGENCNNQISGCNTAEGYTSCPGFANGGCCIPDYACYGVGCAFNSTSTTTTTAALVTVTACPNSYTACAASLGGGCCQSGVACGSGRTCLTTTSSSSSTSTTTPTTTTSRSTSTSTSTYSTTVTSSGSITAVAPARPTASASATESTSTAAEVTPSTTTVGTQVFGVCPTNYYFCSAYYRPGCCMVGRDCALSNCPAAVSSSTLVSNGVTVVVPEGSSTGGTTYYTTGLITGAVAVVSSAVPTGACQSGWQSCAQSVGGSCCPGDYVCGTVCTATGGATGVVSKLAPNIASLRSRVDVKMWFMPLLSTFCGLLGGLVLW